MFDNEKTVHHTGAMIVCRAGNFSCRFCRLDNRGIDDIAMWLRNAFFRQLAGDDLLELVFEAECYEGNFSGGDSGHSVWITVRREESAELIVKAWSVAMLPVEDTIL